MIYLIANIIKIIDCQGEMLKNMAGQAIHSIYDSQQSHSVAKYFIRFSFCVWG